MVERRGAERCKFVFSAYFLTHLRKRIIERSGMALVCEKCVHKYLLFCVLPGAGVLGCVSAGVPVDGVFPGESG